jgi:UDP-N-acetylmuramate--alanine ligase
MSALARYFLKQGKKVGGYDRVQTNLTDTLSSLGADIHYQDDFDQVDETFKNPTHTLVIYTPAIPTTHQELNSFKQQNVTIVKRSEVLGVIANQAYCMAVAGTHGKTTTSAILTHLLQSCGVKVTAFLGGILENVESNLVLEGNDVIVVEADEFDRSFLQLHPNVACITSMDADHLDIYDSHEDLKETFKEFAGRVKSSKSLYVRYGLPLEGISFGLDANAQVYAQNIRVADGGYIFDINVEGTVVPSVRFALPGYHNIANALAAFAMALNVCESKEQLANALSSFQGVHRRFSYRLKSPKVLIDDYAHHPSEIDAVFQAISTFYPHQKNLAVFQPHLFSRTRDFCDDFAKSLSQFDAVILLEIYPAREQPIAQVNSQVLLEKITIKNKVLVSKPDLGIHPFLQKAEVVVMMGAGDIADEVSSVKQFLETLHEV